MPCTKSRIAQSPLTNGYGGSQRVECVEVSKEREWMIVVTA
jgi:hypothetical protein